MFRLIKKLFIGLLSFNGSLATKCMSLNNEQCKTTRLTLIDLNPVELKCYLFMISLDIYNGSYNTVHDLSAKICAQSKTKSKNVKVFNMITKIQEAKTLTKHVSCDCKCRLNSTACNSNQKWNNKMGQWECKNYYKCKNYHSWNPATCNCKNGKYLECIIDESVIMCSEIVNVTGNMSTIVTSIVSINFDDKMEYCILHVVLLVAVLLF